MFKKVLTTAAFISGLAFTSQAQDYTVFKNPVDTTTSGTPVKTQQMENYPYLELANHVTNITGNPITISWKVVSVAIPSDWKVVGMCDNNTCYSDPLIVNGTNTPPPTSPIAAGGNSLFDLRIYAPKSGVSGTGTVKVRTNTLSQTDTLVFIVNKTATSISTIQLDDKRVSLYPNPATNTLQVYTDKTLNPESISIVNITGVQNITTSVEKGKEVTNIDINTLASGMYMVKVTDTKGRMITARKFVKK
jgi:hypothetical protein